ncbi:hypothetical protein CLU79DRAFT_782347 [Phycomyces nitens]|nr:hypothetical protein CLU79DRAFT_782347 [Phycomyces nitens]
MAGNHTISTNNYVESWHRHLKEVYLPTMRTQREDVLVYILWNLVLPDYMKDHVRTMARLQRRILNKAERVRRQKAYGIDEQQTITMIVDRGLDFVQVRSFDKDDVSWYESTVLEMSFSPVLVPIMRIIRLFASISS